MEKRFKKYVPLFNKEKNPKPMDFRLILDYDGVVFKNPYAMEMVSNRSAQYVSKKLNMSYSNAKMLNSTRYKVHGHTVNYLNDIGVDSSLEEYNDFVFGGFDWNDLRMNIRETDYDPIIDIQLVNNLQEHRCVLFSNAPRIWVDNTLDTLGTKTDLLFDHVFTCETISDLKPGTKMYEEIEDYFPEDDFLFIDDSILNIHGLGDRWKTHWFKPGHNIYTEGKKLMEKHGYID